MGNRFWQETVLTLGAGLALASPVIAANTTVGALDFSDFSDVARWFLLAASVLGIIVVGLGTLRLWGVFAFHLILPLKPFDRSGNIQEWRETCKEVPFMRWLLAIDEFGEDRRRNA
jgi:hypothetical protein